MDCSDLPWCRGSLSTPVVLGVILAFLAALGFSCNQILIRMGTQRVPSAASAFYSASTGAVLAISLALIIYWSEIKELPPIAYAWMALLGLVNYPLGRVMGFTAISMIGAVRAGPITGASPIFAAVFAIALLSEEATPAIVVGTLMVTGGLVMVVMGGRYRGAGAAQVVTNNLGYLFALGASVAFGGASVIAKHIVTEYAPGLVAAAFALVIGFFILGALTSPQVVPSLRLAEKRYIGFCLMAGIFSGLAAIFLFTSLHQAPVTVINPVYATSPLFTLILAHLFLQRLERITVPLIVGTMVIVAGVTLVVLS